jgi:putative phage-type endonuclease
MEQGTPEWHAARLGKLTGSRIAMATAKGLKGAPSRTRAKLMGLLACERMTGRPMDHYISGPMDWGIETEAQARLAYQFDRNVRIETVGLVDHPTIPMAGASPDGLVGADGQVQFKCPEVHTHFETILGASIDGGYIKQMQWELAVTGRAWVDFASFDPRVPEEMQLHVVRVKRDPALIETLEAEGRQFLAELDNMVASLRTRFNLAEVLRQSIEAA